MDDQYKSDMAEIIRQQQEAYRQQLHDQAKIIREQTQAQIQQLNGQRPVLEQRFNDNARSAYIQKMQAQKQIPQALAAQGLNGGMSESSNIALGAQYGNAYNGYKRDYDSGLQALDGQIANVRESGSDALRNNALTYNSQVSDMQYKFNQMLAQAQASERAEKLRAQAEAEKSQIAYERQLQPSRARAGGYGGADEAMDFGETSENTAPNGLLESAGMGSLVGAAVGLGAKRTLTGDERESFLGNLARMVQNHNMTREEAIALAKQYGITITNF